LPFDHDLVTQTSHGDSFILLAQTPLLGLPQSGEKSQADNQPLQPRPHSHEAVIDTFGGGRRNLFFSFPMEMDAQKHALLDHNKQYHP
jgi:hypothetical protein